MNTTFQTALRTFETSLNALITSLTTSPTASGAPTAALNLLSADDTLTTTIDTLKQHQANYVRILALRAEAASLEERVKDIVRLAVRYEAEVRKVCGDDEDSEDEDEYDSEDLDGDEVRVSEGLETVRATGRPKGVDYKLLLDFARRISKYNHEAAADAAAAGNSRVRPSIAGTGAGAGADTGTGTGTGHDAEMIGMGTNGTSPDAEPVAAVTKDATSWLDESANMTRQAYMLPYPMEDRIRLGLMGQIQLAAAEGRPGFDADNEVERLLREAEGEGVADVVVPAHTEEEPTRVNEAARAAVHAGSVAASVGAMGGGAAPKPKSKATLDLDLYDPDEDED
ncbi:vitamin-D-receptor interacting mediator subunit 4-domain-containing protein [Aspergillus carlsbadensis]|nr:vitamin-D-receptor interacting mediator subunit 4-domain-containing protein [Aspergillus carlsbadensis]